MRRIAFIAALSALLSVPAGSEARVWTSTCGATVSSPRTADCTVLLAGPIRGTATAQPDAAGNASVHLTIEADPRMVDGSAILEEPILLAECSATAVDGPATCTAEWQSEATLPTPGVGGNGNGNGLPGRCTATISDRGSFSCIGGTV